MHEDISLPICSSYVKWLSKVTSRSFAYGTGLIDLFKNVKVISWGRADNEWRVPTKRNLVFSGLINNSFLQHHAATWRRSSSRLRRASVTSLIGNDKDNFESSTEQFKSHTCVIDGRSFVYMQNKSGDRMAPYGTPCVTKALWIATIQCVPFGLVQKGSFKTISLFYGMHQ